MYIQYPIEMLVLLSVSSDPSALAFVWLVIHKLLFCSMMLHHGWKTSICWCISRSEMEACAILILALEDVVLLNISTWHQFCTCQDVMVLDYCPSRLLMLQLGINFVHQYINTSIHQYRNCVVRTSQLRHPCIPLHTIPGSHTRTCQWFCALLKKCIMGTVGHPY